MINGINHITLAVVDLEKCFAFYREVLGFKALAKRKNKSAYLLSGSDWIVLVQNKSSDHSIVRTTYAHLAFSVDKSNFEIISSKIKSSGAEIWQENSSPGESLYFLDPSGNKLEIHCGDWKSRLQWLKDHPTDEVTLYE